MSPLKQNKNTTQKVDSYKIYFLLITIAVAILIFFMLIIAVHSQSYYSYIGGL